VNIFLDFIQLASAMKNTCDLFVSYDKKLVVSAKDAGLKVN